VSEAGELQVLGFAMRASWWPLRGLPPMRDASHRRGQAKVGNGDPAGWPRPRLAMRTNLEAGSGVRLAAVEVRVVLRRGDVQSIPVANLTPPSSSSILLFGSTASSIGEIDSTRAGHQKIALWSISRGEREWVRSFRLDAATKERMLAPRARIGTVLTLRPGAADAQATPCSRWVRTQLPIRSEQGDAGWSGRRGLVRLRPSWSGLPNRGSPLCFSSLLKRPVFTSGR
jgi:hypothetical protein